VARQDIYRILSELQKLSLIEKIIANPFEFNAVPIDEYCSILLQRKKDVITEVQKQFNKLIQNHETNAKEATKKGNGSYILIPAGEATLIRTKKMIENTKCTIDTICSWNQLWQGLFRYDEVSKKAMERDVKLRGIISKNKESKSLLEFQAFMKDSNLEVRTIRNLFPSTLTMCDRKEVIIASHPRTDAGKSSALWSDNPGIIALVENCFETLWKTAQEIRLF